MRYLALILIFLSTYVSDSYGQNAVELGLERDINRYRWTARVGGIYSVDDWNLSFNNRFSSDAYSIFDNSFVFRDENRLDWTASRPLSRYTDFLITGDVDWFSLSRVFLQNTLVGLAFKPAQGVRFTPLAGFSIDQRPGIADDANLAPVRADAGPAIGASSSYLDQSSDGIYSIEVRADGLYSDLQSRTGYAGKLAGTGRRNVMNSRITTRINLSTARRDTYEAVSFLNRDTGLQFSESVEQTTSDTLQLAIEGTIPLGNRITFTGAGDLAANSRSVRNTANPDETLFFDTRFERRTFNFQSALAYRKQTTLVEISATGGVEEENRSLTNRDALPPVQASQKSNLLRQADFDRGYFQLDGSTRFGLGSRWVTTTSVTARILNHNTPETNPDDRDEVYFSGRLGLLVHLSPELSADISLFGTRYETVYLKSERSAENNIQRSLRLGPAVTWKPSASTSIRLASEVRATYTVDQFVLPGRRPRDQSARELRYEFDMTQHLTSDLRAMLDVSYSTLHLGRFIEDSFAEIPFDTLRINRIWFRVKAGSKYSANIGVRALVRSDYNQNSSVTYSIVGEDGVPATDSEGNAITATITRPGRNIIRQAGPTSAIVIPLNRRSSLRLDGWLIFQRVYQRLYGELPESSADRIREAARKGRLTVIPNLNMAIRWII